MSIWKFDSNNPDPSLRYSQVIEIEEGSNERSLLDEVDLSEIIEEMLNGRHTSVGFTEYLREEKHESTFWLTILKLTLVYLDGRKVEVCLPKEKDWEYAEHILKEREPGFWNSKWIPITVREFKCG